MSLSAQRDALAEEIGSGASVFSARTGAEAGPGEFGLAQLDDVPLEAVRLGGNPILMLLERVSVKKEGLGVLRAALGRIRECVVLLVLCAEHPSAQSPPVLLLYRHSRTAKPWAVLPLTSECTIDATSSELDAGIRVRTPRDGSFVLQFVNESDNNLALFMLTNVFGRQSSRVTELQESSLVSQSVPAREGQNHQNISNTSDAYRQQVIATWSELTQNVTESSRSPETHSPSSSSFSSSRNSSSNSRGFSLRNRFGRGLSARRSATTSPSPVVLSPPSTHAAASFASSEQSNTYNPEHLFGFDLFDYFSNFTVYENYSAQPRTRWDQPALLRVNKLLNTATMALLGSMLAPMAYPVFVDLITLEFLRYPAPAWPSSRSLFVDKIIAPLDVILSHLYLVEQGRVLRTPLLFFSMLLFAFWFVPGALHRSAPVQGFLQRLGGIVPLQVRVNAPSLGFNAWRAANMILAPVLWDEAYVNYFRRSLFYGATALFWLGIICVLYFSKRSLPMLPHINHSQDPWRVLVSHILRIENTQFRHLLHAAACSLCVAMALDAGYSLLRCSIWRVLILSCLSVVLIEVVKHPRILALLDQRRSAVNGASFITPAYDAARIGFSLATMGALVTVQSTVAKISGEAPLHERLLTKAIGFSIIALSNVVLRLWNFFSFYVPLLSAISAALEDMSFLESLIYTKSSYQLIWIGWHMTVVPFSCYIVHFGFGAINYFGAFPRLWKFHVRCCRAGIYFFSFMPSGSREERSLGSVLASAAVLALKAPIIAMHRFWRYISIFVSLASAGWHLLWFCRFSFNLPINFISVLCWGMGAWATSLVLVELVVDSIYSSSTNPEVLMIPLQWPGRLFLVECGVFRSLGKKLQALAPRTTAFGRSFGTFLPVGAYALAASSVTLHPGTIAWLNIALRHLSVGPQRTSVLAVQLMAWQSAFVPYIYMVLFSRLGAFISAILAGLSGLLFENTVTFLFQRTNQSENRPIMTVERSRLRVESSSSRECAICLTGFQDSEMCLLLPCSHFFHSKCVSVWLQTSQVCPLCREPSGSASGSPQFAF